MRTLRKSVFALLLFTLAVQGQSSPPRHFTETRPAMGSQFTVHLYASDERRAAAYFDMAFEEIERVEELLSNYRPSSELSRINRLAAQEAVTTDPEVFAFLQLTSEAARTSGGAFDITVGQLLRAWGFFRGEGRYPSPEELAKARTAVGWQNVVLDSRSRTVRFRVPGVELDPGGIGKGYAADRVIGLLREAGIQSALVDAGSSTMVALGSPPGEAGWRVHIPRPGDRAQHISTVLLRDNALSTSGSYEKFFRLNGRTYCHIFDPRTGEPVQGVLQTTVIVSDGTTSEILSKVMFVLGPDASKKYLHSVSGVKGLWILGEPKAPALATWQWPEPVSPSVSSLRPQNENQKPDQRRFLFQ
jgi:thiamine biosynthesis lipoprotein